MHFLWCIWELPFWPLATYRFIAIMINAVVSLYWILSLSISYYENKLKQTKKRNLLKQRRIEFTFGQSRISVEINNVETCVVTVSRAKFGSKVRHEDEFWWDTNSEPIDSTCTNAFLILNISMKLVVFNNSLRCYTLVFHDTIFEVIL